MVVATEWTSFSQSTDWPSGTYDYWTDTNFSWTTPDGTDVTEIKILLPDVGSSGIAAFSVGPLGDCYGSSHHDDPGLSFASPGMFFIRIKYNGGNSTYKCVVGSMGAMVATDNINNGILTAQDLQLMQGGATRSSPYRMWM
jgi:hypothetical protein